MSPDTCRLAGSCNCQCDGPYNCPEGRHCDNTWQGCHANCPVPPPAARNPTREK